MTEVYLALGSNLGDRASHLARGLKALGRLGEVSGVSGVYETDPVGYTAQPAFLNMVARLDTGLEPTPLLHRIHAIERAEGRERMFRNAPRTLDIDILLFGDRILEETGLVVPHPRMTERAFALVPLLELEPTLVEPGTGRPYSEYLDGLSIEASLAASVRRVVDGEELLDGDQE